MTPAGIVLIVAFVAILVVAVMADKKKSAKFDEDFKAAHPIKVSYKAMYITEDGKLVYYLPSGTLKGYKVWNLNEVGYISTTGANKGVFSICDSNMQVLAGEYVTPSKKNVKEKSYKSFDAGVGNSVAEYAEFLKKEAGIQYLSNGTVVE